MSRNLNKYGTGRRTVVFIISSRTVGFAVAQLDLADVDRAVGAADDVIRPTLGGGVRRRGGGGRGDGHEALLVDLGGPSGAFFYFTAALVWKHGAGGGARFCRYKTWKQKERWVGSDETGCVKGLLSLLMQLSKFTMVFSANYRSKSNLW